MGSFSSCCRTLPSRRDGYLAINEPHLTARDPALFKELARRCSLQLPDDFFIYWQLYYSSSQGRQHEIRRHDPAHHQVYCELLWLLYSVSLMQQPEGWRTAVPLLYPPAM